VIRDIHEVVSWIFVFANAAVGVWALAAHRWPRLRVRAGWIAVGVTQVVVLAQVVLGVILQNQLDADDTGRHQLYGFAAFASVGIIFAYRNEMRDRPHLLYGLGSLWLMGLGIRAMVLV
jgi:hypothetical protein